MSLYSIVLWFAPCSVLLWQCLWPLPGYHSTNLPFPLSPRHLSHWLLQSLVTGADVASFWAQACWVNTHRAHTLGEGHNTSALQETSGIVSHILSGMGSNIALSSSSKLIPSREVPVPTLRMWFGAKMLYDELPHGARLAGSARRVDIRKKGFGLDSFWAKSKLLLSWLWSDSQKVCVQFLFL